MANTWEGEGGESPSEGPKLVVGLRFKVVDEFHGLFWGQCTMHAYLFC